ncbi:MAG: DEAD/DEAH box helicase family protein [Betaproteobacteria bacterium]|nr:DEAD/DEAH box helicase family protein [Betaproteobacteria bacterium]
MPEDKFLYEKMDALADFGVLDLAIPNSIKSNLNPKFPLRPYQIEAFARFLHCYNKDFPGKQAPLHFLFNMATGSGKTLIMAGLILYLYEKGYRNFLFFVDKTNIVNKTRDNFLNPASSKYLYGKEIFAARRRVRIAPVESFAAANPNDINIHFTTIQGLHSRLTEQKENAVSFGDFARHKLALISDESHHMSAATRNRMELYEGTWENTASKIMAQNDANILLEFTATHDYGRAEMREKYKSQVLMRYDLRKFRNDKYSKEVFLLRSDFAQNERILQALVLSQYKREAAAKYGINLKPVILFKSQKVADSHAVKEEFHRMVGGLSAGQIAKIRRSEVSAIKRAFRFFGENGVSNANLAERLKSEFREKFCLSANDEAEKEKHQILLNSMEDANNPIRAVFAVQKLSEGWDVLNLFDIVRCHENRNSPKANTAEAQLIGRGARYFPFITAENAGRYRRKFDGDLKNELRVLEELHYHSINDNHYISGLREALVNEGVLDETEIIHEVKIKEKFKATALYKYGAVWLNERELKNYRGVKSFADLGVVRVNYEHVLSGGGGGEISAFSKNGGGAKSETAHDVKIKDIPRNVVECAIAENPFFAFDKLQRYFPKLSSMRGFTAQEYLGGLSITFRGGAGAEESRGEQLAAMRGLLEQIAREIREQDADYAGTKTFKREFVQKIFKDKTLKFSGGNPRLTGAEQFNELVAGKDWFAFDSFYGTDEEKNFIRLLDRKMGDLRQQYGDIYLLRNEGHFAIYNFADGRAFQPDFVLFMRGKTGDTAVYQIFLEPKGRFLEEHDKWKKDFLNEIRKEFSGKFLEWGGKKYRLVGVPFYSRENENDFFMRFEESLRAKKD